MPGNPNSRVRKRIPKSCRRCHRRKQKCVGFPTCSNCESANQPCSRSESAPSWHHAMSKGALVHRIEVLEDQLAAAQGNLSVSRGRTESPDAISTRQSHRWNETKSNHLNGVIRFLTLGHDSNEEQAYLGPSSGVSMVENVNQIIHDAVVGKLLPVNSNNQPQEPTNTNTNNNDEIKASPPDEEIGARILDAYFKNMHIRLPFLDRRQILALHERRHQPAGTTPQEQFDQFKIFMIYAIGAAILQMTESYESTPPNRFLVTALQFDPTLRESISIASIEAMLLLVLYNLRSTSNSSVWYMIGLAMRACVDFGLHRESRYKKLPPHEAQLQRRLFWSVYLTERHTAWALGRPFSISEEEIDTNLPTGSADITNEPPANENGAHNTDADQPHDAASGRFIASIGLQRIVSQIHTRIYRVDKQISSLLPEIAPLMSALEDFQRTLPSLNLAESDFIHMHWNNSIRILLQPFLSILHPQDKLIRTCLFASGQMCQLFKRLRQRDSSGHSFLLVNSVFMAGLTMCFCLFRSPTLWSPAASNDIRACSSAVSVMAERNPKLKKYRDGLETVINRVMEFVENSYQAPPNTGAHSQIPLENSQMLHPATTPDSIISMGTHMHSLPGQSGLPTDPYEFLPSDIFSELPGFPSNLQSLFTGDHTDVMDLTLQGVFTETFWATENMNGLFSGGEEWTI